MDTPISHRTRFSFDFCLSTDANVPSPPIRRAFADALYSITDTGARRWSDRLSLIAHSLSLCQGIEHFTLANQVSDSDDYSCGRRNVVNPEKVCTQELRSYRAWQGNSGVKRALTTGRAPATYTCSVNEFESRLLAVND
jgi:hypothetical protein